MTDLVRRTVTLQREKEDRIISDFAQRFGLDFSTAVRFIVNDWRNSDVSRAYWVDAQEIAETLA